MFNLSYKLYTYDDYLKQKHKGGLVYRNGFFDEIEEDYYVGENENIVFKKKSIHPKLLATLKNEYSGMVYYNWVDSENEAESWKDGVQLGIDIVKISFDDVADGMLIK